MPTHLPDHLKKFLGDTRLLRHVSTLTPPEDEVGKLIYYSNRTFVAELLMIPESYFRQSRHRSSGLKLLEKLKVCLAEHGYKVGELSDLIDDYHDLDLLNKSDDECLAIRKKWLEETFLISETLTNDQIAVMIGDAIKDKMDREPLFKTAWDQLTPSFMKQVLDSAPLNQSMQQVVDRIASALKSPTNG